MEPQLIKNINKAARHYLRYFLGCGMFYHAGFRLHPGLPHGITFTNIPQGRYLLQVWHESETLHAEPPGVCCEMRINGEAVPFVTASAMGVRHKDSGAFFYLGGGDWDDGLIRFRQRLHFDGPVGVLELVFHNLVTEPCDIVSVVLQVAAPEVAVHGALCALQALVAPNAAFILYSGIARDARRELYAGLVSSANVLGRIAPTVLFANDRATFAELTRLVEDNGVSIIGPWDFGLSDSVDTPAAVNCLRLLDVFLPGVRHIFIHGLEAADALLADRRFAFRAAVRMDDLCSTGNGDGRGSQANAIRRVLLHGDAILTQSRKAARRLSKEYGPSAKMFSFPTAIPGALPRKKRERASGTPLAIGFSGELVPGQGLEELCAWTRRLRDEAVAFSVHVFASRQYPADETGEGHREELAAALREAGATLVWESPLQRPAWSLLDMDYVWCFRPEEVERQAFEPAPFLVEMVASGGRCLCYPSEIHWELLGEKYPFYVRSYEDFRNVLLSDPSLGEEPGCSQMLRENFSVAHQVALIEDRFTGPSPLRGMPLICFASHDFKFIDPYISRLKQRGCRVLRDEWRWGYSRDSAWNEYCHTAADSIFCEWGLAAAVWHANRNREKKPLHIRIHLQEIGEKAARFGHAIQHENVTSFLFVSERVRRTAVNLFGWPEEKTVVIPNFVLTDEYVLGHKDFAGTINLGMVGIIPKRKRFDRGVRLLEQLLDDGLDARLHIKGPRPETVEFMKTPARQDEMKYIADIYAYMAAKPKVGERVFFEPWGNDVALWYENIHFILSCSDEESFHYALADGVASGCLPLLWPWEGAADIYTPDWLVEDVADAAAKVRELLGSGHERLCEMIASNRELIADRYGYKKIFRMLDAVLGLSTNFSAEQDGEHVRP